MELLTITLAANETKQFAKAGRYFEIIDSTYAVNVAFNAANGAQSDQMVGALSGLYLEDPFAHFSITNGPVAQSIILLVMEVGRGGSRRQPGNVRVIDSSVDKTRAGNQFLQSVFVGAVVGQQSVVGIRHNGASGFVVIKRLTLQSAVAGYVQTYKGLGTGTVYVGPTGLPNKLVASAVSPNARMFGANTAAVLPTVGEMPAFSAWFAYSTQAAQAVPVQLDSPIVLAPNDMFYVAGNALNRDIGAVFDIEETI